LIVVLTNQAGEGSCTWHKAVSGRGIGEGIITIRHRGGGVKRLFRVIDFGQDKAELFPLR